MANNETISKSTGETIVGLFTGGGALNASAYFLGSYVIPYSPIALSDSQVIDFIVGGFVGDLGS